MSGKGDDDDRQYRVGRGKPPKETRFRPGASGNPMGRPPKNGRSFRRPLEQATEDVILEEAYRPVTLNEGGKSVTMSAIQAITRSAFVKGIKGNAQAQKNCIQAVQMIERRVSEAHAKIWHDALLQKAALELERAQWLASGKAEADMLMHPDDLEICPKTGGVRNFVPLTEEARGARRRAVEIQDEYVATIARGLKARELGIETQQWQDERQLAEELLETLNEVLPPRYRKEVRGINPGMHKQAPP